MSTFNVILYCLAFAIIGIPLIGYIVDILIKVGKKLYDKVPFVKRFFDEYISNYGTGLLITIASAIVYGILHWIGIF